MGRSVNRKEKHGSIAYVPQTEWEMHIQGLDYARKATRERKQEQFPACLYELSLRRVRDSNWLSPVIPPTNLPHRRSANWEI